MNERLLRLIAQIGPEHLYRFWVSAQSEWANHLEASRILGINESALRHSMKVVSRRLNVSLYDYKVATTYLHQPGRQRQSTSRRTIWSPEAIRLRDALDPIFRGLPKALADWERGRSATAAAA